MRSSFSCSEEHYAFCSVSRLVRLWLSLEELLFAGMMRKKLVSECRRLSALISQAETEHTVLAENASSRTLENDFLHFLKLKQVTV